MSFIGSAEDRERFWAAGSDLGLRHAGTGVAAHALELPEPVPVNEGFVIPSNVSYVARAFAPSDADPGERGVWAVATRALTYDYLWNEVRVKGGAAFSMARNSSMPGPLRHLPLIAVSSAASTSQ